MFDVLIPRNLNRSIRANGSENFSSTATCRRTTTRKWTSRSTEMTTHQNCIDIDAWLHEQRLQTHSKRIVRHACRSNETRINVLFDDEGKFSPATTRIGVEYIGLSSSVLFTRGTGCNPLSTFRSVQPDGKSFRFVSTRQKKKLTVAKVSVTIVSRTEISTFIVSKRQRIRSNHVAFHWEGNIVRSSRVVRQGKLTCLRNTHLLVDRWRIGTSRSGIGDLNKRWNDAKVPFKAEGS